MKKIIIGILIFVLLVTGGYFIYKDLTPVDAGGNETVGGDLTVSEYTLSVQTNAGTVIDYVDYETISDEEYEIETEGFNRQFCELSIYNTETEEQLQNNSVIKVDDELQINLAIPEGYKLNAFFINGYYADFSELITVTGNAEIYIDISRISCQLISRMLSYHEDDLSFSIITVESDGIITNYEIDVFFDDVYHLCNLYFGDIVTIKIYPGENYQVGELSLDECVFWDCYNFLYFYNYMNSEPELIDNMFSFIVSDVYYYYIFISLASL